MLFLDVFNILWISLTQLWFQGEILWTGIRLAEFLPAEKVPGDCICHRAKGYSEVLEFLMHFLRFSSKCRCSRAGGHRLGCSVLTQLHPFPHPFPSNDPQEQLKSDWRPSKEWTQMGINQLRLSLSKEIYINIYQRKSNQKHNRVVNKMFML